MTEYGLTIVSVRPNEPVEIPEDAIEIEVDYDPEALEATVMYLEPTADQ